MRYLKNIIAMLIAATILFASVFQVSAGELTIVEDEEKQALPIPDISAASAIVMDAKSGAIIYEKNAHAQMPMASTTKIMTALLSLESGDIGREVVITQEMLAYDEAGSTKLGLVAGDRITMHDLIVAMMLLSANDAAQSAAVEIGGSFDAFASLMNERAAEIGMLNTHFITPSGLDADGHYSTSYDMALLAIEAMKNPDFTYFTSMAKHTIYYGNPMTERTLWTHNYLLQGQKYGYKGCDGLKTGYTDEAGNCLVSHVERDGVSLVCVTLRAPGYWADHRKLYDYAFSNYVSVNVNPEIPTDSVLLVGGTQQTANVSVAGSDSIYVLKEQAGSVTKQIEMSRFVYAPVSEGQVVGYVQYMYGTTALVEFPIQVTENVDCVTTDWLSAYISAVKYTMNNPG